MVIDFYPGRDVYLCRKPLVLACGCFDLLTVGHVRHLQAAKELVWNGYLAVLVTADEFVNKPGRPILSENDRAEMVDSLRFVDYTIVNRCPTAVQAILQLKPQVYVKGREYETVRSTEMLKEIEAVESVGGRMVYTDTEEVHTSDILRTVTCHVRDIVMG